MATALPRAQLCGGGARGGRRVPLFARVSGVAEAGGRGDRLGHRARMPAGLRERHGDVDAFSLARRLPSSRLLPLLGKKSKNGFSMNPAPHPVLSPGTSVDFSSTELFFFAQIQLNLIKFIINTNSN